MLTENTMRDDLPYSWIALCTTNIPRNEAAKQIMAKMRAASVFSIPNNTYWNADMVDEKKTMKEHVAAVTCTKTWEQKVRIPANLTQTWWTENDFEDGIHLRRYPNMKKKWAYKHSTSNSKHPT